jgi:NAD(P)H-hydrate epimerase
MALAGASVEIILFGTVEETKGDARVNFDAAGREVDRLREIESRAAWDSWFYDSWQDWDVIVDAVFGTGLNRPIDVWLANVIRHVNIVNEENSRIAISIDLPSGLNSDSGELFGESFHADLTVTFTRAKPANVLAPASSFGGKLFVEDIGSPEELVAEFESDLFLGESDDARNWLIKSKFDHASYKNKRGHALLIAGSENYSGAAVLAGNAAMRSGVGLVTIGTPQSSKDPIACRVIPEIIVRPLAETDSGAVSEAAIEEVEDFSKNADAIAIGSGLSASDESTAMFVRHFVENRRMPTILDADALTVLSPLQMPARVSSPHVSKGSSSLILTPHEGEFLRLLGTDHKGAIKDRAGAVREFSQKHNVILVLKGERVLIGEPGGKVVVNPTGNSGLGKAGNGDTLTGILVGFVAQAVKMNIDIFETVVAAVYVAGMAGDIAEKKHGKRVMTASDVRECLTEAFEQIGS